jgi:hypothetical protein
MIASRQQFAATYFQRCLATDGYIVMKSSSPFRVGQLFGSATSAMLGAVNEHMVVAGVSSAREAQEQAKRIGNVTLRPVDLQARFYYRVAPEQSWKPWVQ